jgi:hypothetical protein
MLAVPALVVVVQGVAEVHGALEGDELARHHLVHVAVERVVVVLVLVHVNASPQVFLVFQRRQVDPSELDASGKPSPAVCKRQTEVGPGEGCVAEGLDESMAQLQLSNTSPRGCLSRKIMYAPSREMASVRACFSVWTRSSSSSMSSCWMHLTPEAKFMGPKSSHKGWYCIASSGTKLCLQARFQHLGKCKADI